MLLTQGFQYMNINVTEEMRPFPVWHFDKWRKDEYGQYMKTVGRFVGDWKKDIDTARGMGVEPAPYNRQGYGHAANKASTVDGVYHAKEDAPMLEQGGDPSIPMFHKRGYSKDDRDTLPTFVKMAEYFGLGDKRTWKFHDQLVSDQLPNHIDNLPGNPSKERVVDNPDFKHNIGKARFLVFLEDWEPGQLFMFGTYYHTHWRAGEIVTWEWSTLPHATWNGSWRKRPALQLTGDVTEQTLKVINTGHADREIYID